MIEWRTVAEAPEYQVSNDGQVRSIYTNKPLKGGMNKGWYRKHVLCTGGGRIHRTVPVLVCTAFHGPRPAGMVVRHLNGNPLDDRSCNLEWSTQKVNMSDKLLHGTAQRGERHPGAVLTEEKVRAIRASSEPLKVLSARYGVADCTISAVRHRRLWPHVI